MNIFDIFQNFGDIVFELLYTIPAVLLALSFHEFSHGFISYKLGDPTAKYSGRLTLNPLSHLDPVGTIMMILSSLSGFGFGWAKPVPVNPNYYKDAKKGMRLSSLAGPLSNLCLAIASYWVLLIYNAIMVKVGGYETDNSTLITITEFVFSFLSVLISVNIGLGCFNMLPIPPLDGWKIFGSLLPSKTYWSIMQYEDKIGMLFLLIMVVKPGILTVVLNPLFNIIYEVVMIFGLPIETLIEF